MTTADTVIKALHACRVAHSCDGCPYNTGEHINCIASMETDAIDVIKRQQETIERLATIHDPRRPTISDRNPVSGRRHAWCGYCGRGIKIGSTRNDRENFCHHCGCPVSWDE